MGGQNSLHNPAPKTWFRMGLGRRETNLGKDDNPSTAETSTHCRMEKEKVILDQARERHGISNCAEQDDTEYKDMNDNARRIYELADKLEIPVISFF